MKKLVLILAVCLAARTVVAQSYDQFYQNLPFQMERVQLPAIPDMIVNITDFGGVGDGIHSNTDAFAKAMTALKGSGGGTLVVPRGIWVTGPIHFVDNVNLQVSDGALILASTNYDEFPLIETFWEGLAELRATSLIMAHGVNNIAITGNGIIDGNGEYWRPVKREKMTDNQWRGLQRRGGVIAEDRLWFPDEGGMKGYFDRRRWHEMTRNEQEEFKTYFRPVLVSIQNCKNVLLQGVTFQNSPAWNIHPVWCENLTVDQVIVRNPWFSQNGDGIDVESCKNVLVVNSSFDVGDDAICIKSGKDKEGREIGIPTENLIVDNCIVYHGHGGFVVGSEMSGGARNMVVRNCLFIGTDVGLRFKSRRGRGGVVENIWIDNVDMINIPGEALLFDLYYGRIDPNAPVPPVTEETPSFRNIHINNISCRGAGTAMFFNGLPEMNVQNVTIEHAVMQTTRGIIINESDQVKLSNVNIMPAEGPAIRIFNSKNVDVQSISFGDGTTSSEIVTEGNNSNLTFDTGLKVTNK